MKFGIIFVLMMVIGQFVYATPSWIFSAPTTQEEIDRIAYATRPERVAEVVTALDAEIARLERIPRGHRYYFAIQNALPMFKAARQQTQISIPYLLYNILNAILHDIDDTTSRIR